MPRPAVKGYPTVDTVNERLTTVEDGPDTVNERLSTGGPGPEGQPDTVTETLAGEAEPVSAPEPTPEPETEAPKPRKRAAK